MNHEKEKKVVGLLFITASIIILLVFANLLGDAQKSKQQATALQSQFELAKTALNKVQSEKIAMAGEKTLLAEEVTELKKTSLSNVLGVAVSPTVTVKTTSTPVATPTPTPAKKVGFIEGALSFPGDKIPDTLAVCAENLSTYNIYCTKDHVKNLKFKFGVGYLLEVPEGEYFVYAKLMASNKVGYYTKAVTCGFKVECTDHENIKVSVGDGKTVRSVDPGDWYKDL